MIRRTFRKAGAGKFLLLWAFSLLNGIGARSTGPDGQLLHMLALLSDENYAVFVVLPVLLFLCGGLMGDDAQPVLLRYGAYSRYFRAKARALAAVCTVLWLGQLVVLFLTSLGLPRTSGWPDAQGSGIWRNVFALLKTIFPSPELALFCSALHLLIGYWLVSILALWLGHFLPRISAIAVLAALYVLTVFQARLPAMGRPPLVFLTGLIHWTLLLYNCTAPWRSPLTLCSTVLLLTVIGYTVRSCWQRQISLLQPKPTGLSSLYRRLLFTRRNLALAGSAVVLLALWTWFRGAPPESGRLWVFELLAGHGTGSLWVIGMLFLLLAEVLPLWPLGDLIAKVLQGQTLFAAVRLRRQTDVLWDLLKTAVLWLLFWGVLLLIAAFLPVWFLDLPADPALTLWATGLRLLDMALQFLLLLSVLCLSGQPTAGFEILVLLHLLAVLPIPWLPVGLSSLLRLRLPEAGGAVSPGAAFVLLTGCCLALLLWLWRYGIRKLFAKIGG